VAFKLCAIGIKRPNVCQENIPQTITPPPPAHIFDTMQDGATTNRQTTVQYNNGLQNSISEGTTRQSLSRMGYCSGQPHRVALLSAKNKKKRLLTPNPDISMTQQEPGFVGSGHFPLLNSPVLVVACQMGPLFLERGGVHNKRETECILIIYSPILKLIKLSSSPPSHQLTQYPIMTKQKPLFRNVCKCIQINYHIYISIQALYSVV
jgi:hypothetical protein